MVQGMLLALAVSTLSVTGLAQSSPGKNAPALLQASAKKPAVAGHATHYAPNPLSPRANLHYDLMWGVDSFTVKSVEAGEMIRFTYRVVDPGKAAVLNDKKNEPSLIDPKAGVKLVVPEMDKVGKLRQSSTPIAGKTYWMAFSNKGRHVKPGDRVDVVIGQFRAGGLVVQ
jgi:hypothetical protein